MFMTKLGLDVTKLTVTGQIAVFVCFYTIELYQRYIKNNNKIKSLDIA